MIIRTIQIEQAIYFQGTFFCFRLRLADLEAIASGHKQFGPELNRSNFAYLIRRGNCLDGHSHFSGAWTAEIVPGHPVRRRQYSCNRLVHQCRKALPAVFPVLCRPVLRWVTTFRLILKSSGGTYFHTLKNGEQKPTYSPTQKAKRRQRKPRSDWKKDL